MPMPPPLLSPHLPSRLRAPARPGRGRCLRIALLALLGLAAGTVFGAGDAALRRRDPSGNAAFLAAVHATPVGQDAAKAYFLVDILRHAGAPADEVTALQRELLHAYLAQLATPAAPPALPPPGAWASLLRALPGRAQPAPDTVAAAIARGRARPGPLEAPFRAAWQSAFDQGLALRLGPGEGRSPVFLMNARELEPLGPGAWAAPSADGRVWLRLSLRLANTTARPLPIHRPALRLGGANEGAPLVFQCDWDRTPPLRPPSEMQANAVTLLAPGAESAPLACETEPAPAFWRERLPALLAARTGDAAERPRLVSQDLDSARRLFHLELALADDAPQAAGWRRQMMLARQAPGSQWAPGEGLLEPPVQRRWASAPQQGWRGSLAALQGFMAVTVLGLGLFAAGRGLRRAGVPSVAVGVGTLAAGAGAFALALTQLGGGSGHGSLWTGIGLWSLYFGPMLLAVAGLHALHRLLDAEDRSWWQTVASGWRHAASLTRHTTRAEFWGFLAHCAWLWMLARICFAPLDRWIGAALLLPVLTLALRRLLSLTRDDLAEIGLVVVASLLLVLLQAIG